MVMNARSNFRLRRQIDIYWKVDEQQFAHKAKIHDISLSGIKMEVGKEFKPQDKLVLLLSCPDIPELPKKARLKWSKAVATTGGYVCGVYFVKENAGIDHTAAWKKWMEDHMAQLADASDNKIISKYLDFEENH
jgi:hypothetical protein